MKKLLVLLALLFASPAFAAFNKVEVFSFSNISASTAAFILRGGNYGLTCHATFGGGNIALQRLSPDGATYVTVITALTADGYGSANLPSGSYRLAITTATAVYCDVVAIVTTQ
jgi:hypothetical protein